MSSSHSHESAIILRDVIRKMPFIGPIAAYVYRMMRDGTPLRPINSSSKYWEHRYAIGRSSGDGSYGKLATFKADVINAFLAEQQVGSVIELGCGDGNQLRLLRVPKYLGLDVSPTAIKRCRRLFSCDSSKEFGPVGAYRGEQAALALSLDVIYHLVEDEVFEWYMRALFGAAKFFVVVYSSNMQNNEHFEPHIRHRTFTEWIWANLPHWELMRYIPNRYPYQGDTKEGSLADFFIFRRRLENLDLTLQGTLQP